MKNKKYLLFFCFILLEDVVYAANECGSDFNISCWDCGKTDNDLCTARLDGTKLTITGSGNMRSYSVPGYELGEVPWPQSITEVDISGVQDISQGAFVGFKNLIKVNIGEGVKSVHWYTFTDCASLNEVNFSDTVSMLGNYSFQNTNLTTLVIPERLFLNGGNALKWGTQFSNTPLEKLYCPETYVAECTNALQTSGMSDEQINKVMKTYSKFGDAYLYKGKFYQSPNDIKTKKNIKKRIYTVGEANAVSGKKNTVKIRYK